MKSLFNFYLEDSDKIRANEKLVELCGEQNKGQLAALIRVLLKNFLATPNEQLQTIKNQISDEYVYSEKKNKRSRL